MSRIRPAESGTHRQSKTQNADAFDRLTAGAACVLAHIGGLMPVLISIFHRGTPMMCPDSSDYHRTQQGWKPTKL
jgi:hypothetical protein